MKKLALINSMGFHNINRVEIIDIKKLKFELITFVSGNELMYACV